MDKVRERSRTLQVMLAGAMVSGVDGTTLVLSHESANLAKRLGEQRNLDVIQDALSDALGLQWRVRYEVGAPAAVPTMAATPAASDEEEEAERARRSGVQCGPGTPPRPRGSRARATAERAWARVESTARGSTTAAAAARRRGPWRRA